MVPTSTSGNMLFIDFDHTQAPAGMSHEEACAWAAGANMVLDRLWEHLSEDERDETAKWVQRYSSRKV